jgi:hypothetical protein
MMPFEPACLPTGIGTLPHENAEEACELIFENFRGIPFWPQLPRRAPSENMYAQFAKGLPGIREEDGRLIIDTSSGFEEAMTAFYERYLAAQDVGFPLDRARAEGFFAFVEMFRQPRPKKNGFLPTALKGHVTGPVSLGLSIQEPGGKPVLYNDLAMDAIAKNISMVARWQEDTLGAFGLPTIMFFDEPFMATYGSAFFNYSADLVAHYLEMATEGIKSLFGVHCCGNTDWNLILDSHASIISFDAYGYAGRLLLYSEALGEFLQRGGVLAAGIVPALWDAAKDETVESLFARFDGFLDSLERRGIPRDVAAVRTLITPSCGLGSQTVPAAQAIVEMTSALSRTCRERFGLLGKEKI